MPVDIAIISNEPTPYRLHVLNRIADELPEAKLHSIFTNRPDAKSVPWRVDLNAAINPVVFPEHGLAHSRFNFTPRAYRLFGRVRDYLVNHQVKMVIQLGYFDLLRLAMLRWSHGAGLPLLISSDSNVFGEGRVPWYLRPIKRQQVRWAVKHAAGLMPMGTCGRAFWRIYIDHDKPCFLFPYEPDYSRLTQADPQARQAFETQHGLPPGRKRMLYCGRLVPHKGVELLIRAFVRVADEISDWDLIFAGDGPLRQTLENLTPAKLKPRVHFLGFLQSEETAICQQVSDVLVHPSYYEPWGLVINEAVAAGLAVVTTEVVGAAVELVRHGYNGLIIPPRHETALADALITLARGEGLAKMQTASADMLNRWREQADPVEGVRQAMAHFQLIS